MADTTRMVKREVLADVVNNPVGEPTIIRVKRSDGGIEFYTRVIGTFPESQAPEQLTSKVEGSVDPLRAVPKSAHYPNGGLKGKYEKGPSGEWRYQIMEGWNEKGIVDGETAAMDALRKLVEKSYS